MSQPSGYHFQSYADPNNSLKGAPPPMVNGQPSASQQQNGIQSPHYNLTGTPSSQSSRDPSRETSRDPSPTHYLHNQYRPQLSRPPMPPINGQQSSNPNIMPPPPQMTQTQLYSPTTIPYNAQYNSNVMNTNLVGNAANVSSGIELVPTGVPFTQSSALQNAVSTSQIPQTSSSQNLSSGTYTTGEKMISSSSAGSESTKTASMLHSPNQNYLWTANSQQTNLSKDLNKVPVSSDNADNADNSNNVNSASSSGHIPSSQPQNQPSSNVSFNQSNQATSQDLMTPDQNKTSSLPTASINQPLQNMNRPLNQSSNQMIQNTSSPGVRMPHNQPQHVNYESQPANVASTQNIVQPPPSTIRTQQQNIFSSAQSVQSSPHNMPTFSHSANTNMHQFQTNSMQNQVPLNSQNLSGLQSISSQQDPYLAQQIKSQSQYTLQSQMQQNTYGNYTADTLGLGPISQQSQNVYGSQQNLASQRKYPQTSYGAQAPPNTANISTTIMAPSKSSVPLTGTGQYQTRSPTGVPLSQGQQLYTYPTRSQPMSNIPLDSVAKRYPGMYADQMNQLNNQMSGMSVTQAGFNKIWGVESIDLLQSRNILPPEKVEPPQIRLHQEFLDSVNCSPDIFRCTLTKIPESNSLLQKSRLPLGVLIHPFKDLNHLPVIQCSTIVRCRACRTYINPFVYFVDSKRWKCNLCYRVNELPEEFQFDPVTKSYGDPSRRPEVKTSTIEFIAPSEYMLRPPQPAVYLFVFDVSRLAVESGYLTIVCNTLSEELSRLPGDGRTQIGFLAVDSAIHFFSMPDNVSQPHEMIMLDVDDVFLPCPENLIVNLKEREELVRDLLAQLPTKFQGTHDMNSALGAGLQAAYKLMSPTGGRVTVFQTCLPNLGPGLLQAREDPNTRASKDVPHLNPATDFYKRLALDCSGQQIAVDLFLLNSQYSDLATLSGMCKFSGGCIYHLPLFRASRLQHSETLERMLRRYLTRKIGFEAVMRIRCTRGLSIHTFHGNFFVRSTDLLSLPNVNPDAGFGMQIAIEENLSDVQSVCFQAALLYTSSKGERRIRVHTLCLPVVSSLSDVLHAADQQCIIGLLSKMAVDRSQQSSLSDARDALINVAIDVLSAYKLSQSVGSDGLLAPGSLKLLPLYIIALLKCVAFRSGTSTRLDDRVFEMCQLKTLPLCQLIQRIYPDLYPVHSLDDRNSKDIDGKVCPQPPRLHLTAEKLDSRGAFVMDAGDKIFLYVGKNIHPMFCCNVLGASAFPSIPEEFYELPELDTIENERLRNFIFSLQEEKPYYASVQVIRDDSHFRTFVERLIEDRFESALSYYEFLQHLKTQVK